MEAKSNVGLCKVAGFKAQNPDAPVEEWPASFMIRSFMALQELAISKQLTLLEDSDQTLSLSPLPF